MLVLEKTNPRAMTKAERDELWAFFSPMVSRSRERFERGLEAYQELHCWRRKPDRALVGFAMVRSLNIHVAGTPTTVFYLGSVGLAKEVRGHALPLRRFYWRVLVEYLKRPWRPLFVVFCASTSKSYRSLIRYIPLCWPHPFRETPAHIKDLFASVMNAIGEDAYDAENGVVKRYGRSRWLEGVVADAPESAQDPVIAFYAKRNPAQHEGDTLAVAIPVTIVNLVRVAWRMFHSRPAKKQVIAGAAPQAERSSPARTG